MFMFYVYLFFLYRKHRKLQKKIVDVNYDLASNKDNIKGCILIAICTI